MNHLPVKLNSGKDDHNDSWNKVDCIMSDMDKLSQIVHSMEFDLDEFEKMQDAQNACIKEMARTDEILQGQLDAQRACLEELVKSVESLQRQIDSLETRGRPKNTASAYTPRKLPSGRPHNPVSGYMPQKLPRRG
jgi:septal ring factor EnvC (AmiA/AmiB activator)